MKRLAVVAGGWHWPRHFYVRMTQLAQQLPPDWQVALFAISHRDPELPVVAVEKTPHLRRDKPYIDFDHELYRAIVTQQELADWGWSYCETPNTVGDFEFLNQWAERHDWTAYDIILQCHDDMFLSGQPLIRDVLTDQAKVYRNLGPDPLPYEEWKDWLVLSNCSSGKRRPFPGYVRGSCTFLRRELMERWDGKIDQGELPFTREDETETPYTHGIKELEPWNSTTEPLQAWLHKPSRRQRVRYLSPHYCISPYGIECQRGFVHWHKSRSFREGMHEYQLVPTAVEDHEPTG